MERDKDDVRHRADRQHILAEHARALVSPACTDRIEIRLLTGDGKIAAQAVRRVKNALRRARIALKPQKHIHQHSLMAALTQGAADARAARKRHIALHTQSARQNNDTHSFSS